MKPGLLRSSLVLGPLAAVGPLAIDIYLPALPAIEADLNAGIASTQMTLTAFFLTFGLSQLVYGPLSDQVGRKLPIYIGLFLFIVGSISCGISTNIEWLIASRLLQGVGAAAVMVIPRAIIRDMYTGYEATRLMALVMLVISVSPMLAPLAGTGLIAIGSWHTIFFFLSGAAILTLFLTVFMLPETLEPTHRVPVNAKTFFEGTKTLLSDATFMGLTLIGGFGLASFFVFIASASFVYTGHFGLSLVQFSIAFAVNAIGFFASSQVAAKLGQRFGMTQVIVYAVTGFLFFELILLSLTLLGFGTLPVVMFFLFCGNACLGLVIPSTMVMALDKHGDIAGLASSLGGTLQMVTGGLMIAAASQFFDGTVTPLVAAIAFCSVAAFVLMKVLRIGRETVTGTSAL
ncbi:multidrug effflux MFS transporter [Roseibium algae]|uniref:Bcr/CflA family efflux transporter n=1 Tax=Roseibium algae TaxID=3123038 RepID=A0ABU8THV6_9HYPH